MKRYIKDFHQSHFSSGVLLSVLIVISVILLSACQPTALPSTGSNATMAAPTSSSTMPSSGSNAATAAPMVSSTAPMVMTTSSSPSGGNPAVTASSTQSGSGQSTSQSVELANFAFNPKQVSVPVGTTVVWTNKDNVAHTVTADDKSFDSGNLNPGATFKFTFTKAGTFPYHCQYHGGPNGQGMSGVVTVTGQ